MAHPDWSVFLGFLLLSFSRAEVPVDPEVKMALFNDELLRLVETEDIARLQSQDRMDELRHRLGVLALYFRIFKEFLPLQSTFGYKHVYPSQAEFNSELATECSQGLEKCLDYISEYLKQTQPWLTGYNGTRPETELTREGMQQLINDNAASLELSAAQVLCWMTTKEVSVFNQIPFCGYKISNDSKVVWPAQLYDDHPEYVDEFLGDPFVCAYESFCPDPCCLDVDSKSLAFTRGECLANTCRSLQKCRLLSKFNDDLSAQRENKWNVSCPCGPGMFFRSDVAQCVHENICAKNELCGTDEECLNVLGGAGYTCVCQLGFVREVSGCVKYGFSDSEWSGPALADSSSSHRPNLLFPLVLLFV